MTFGGFDKRRDETLHTLRDVHARSKVDEGSGALRWLPHALRLFPPLRVTNLLPRAVNVRVAPIEMGGAQAKLYGWPVLPNAMNPQVSGVADEGESLILPPGERAAIHDVGMLGPIRMYVGADHPNPHPYTSCLPHRPW